MRPIGTRTRSFAMLLLGLAAGGAILGGCSDEATPDPSIGTNPAVNPPPISGGTLLVAKDGRTAVAADPDRDRVWIVDLEKRALAHEVVLSDGDEPGRVVEDGAGRVHVALRSGGALASIDLASGEIVSRRLVCPAPRGVAYDAKTDAVHVACAGGELVTLPAAGGKATRRMQLERDLRDVLVDGDRLLVSRLKTAEVLVVNADGSLAQRAQPPNTSVFTFDMKEHIFEPTVAWRMLAGPEGSVVLVHQRATTSAIELAQPSAYGPPPGPCDGNGDFAAPISQSALTTLPRAIDGTFTSSTSFSRSLPVAALQVDVALSPNGATFATVSAGKWMITTGARAADGVEVPGPCEPGDQKPVPGQPTAIAFQDEARLVVQLREPAALYFPADGTLLALPGESRFDTGHDIFHKAQGGGALACASCHPEGHEDGRVWNFDPIGQRRTQDIAGGILATAPLHWDGDMTSMASIMNEVLGRRMGGSPPGPLPLQKVERWIDAVPALPRSAPADVEAVARGEALFNDEVVGCASCHSGAMLTNNKSVDVGTGKEFQVPSLVGIASRAPFMHDGCAPTLQARFGGYCGGGDAHGRTSHLAQTQIDDLVAYLETL